MKDICIDTRNTQTLGLEKKFLVAYYKVQNKERLLKAAMENHKLEDQLSSQCVNFKNRRAENNALLVLKSTDTKPIFTFKKYLARKRKLSMI